TGRAESGALAQGGPPEAHQTRFLQSTRRPAHLCAGLELAGGAGLRSARTGRLSHLTLVGDAWSTPERQTHGSRSSLARGATALGLALGAYLGPRFCRTALAGCRLCTGRAFCATLAETLRLAQSARRKAPCLAVDARLALLGT